MQYIQLSRGLSTIVDDADYEELSRRKWYTHSGGYAVRNIPTGNGTRAGIIYMHRQIVGAQSGIEVDHINGDKLDNRRSNLRLCTTAENQHNRKVAFGTSKFKGVRWDKERRKWRAQIVVAMKTIFLGRFENEDDAARAYDEAARHYFGEFAHTNL